MNEQELFARAEENKEKGNLRASVINLKSLLQQNANNNRARILLGEIYLQMGKGASAEKEFLVARELGVDSWGVWMSIGRAILLQGDPRRITEEIYMEDHYSDAEKAELYALYGKSDLMQNKIGFAEEKFKTALALEPRTIEAVVGLGNLAVRRGKLSAAQKQLKLALEIEPDNIEILALQGDLAWAQKDFAKAESVFQQLVEAQPYILHYRIALVQAQLKMGMFDEAVSDVETVLKDFPDYPLANYLRAFAAYQKKDYETTQVYTDKVLMVDRNHLPSLFLSGAANYSLGRFEQAYESMTRFVAKLPRHDKARKILVATQIKMGMVDDAAKSLDPVMEFSENDVAFFIALGNAAFNRGDFRSGAKYLERAAALQPLQASILSQLGYARLLQGEAELGVEDLKRAIELDSKLESPKLALIVAQMRTGDFAKALESVKQFQQKHPESPHGFTLEGGVYWAKGDTDQAKTLFRKALDIKPGDPNASQNLAKLALNEGDQAQARTVYENTLKHYPGDRNTLIRLIELEAQSGNAEKVVTILEEAVDNNPNTLETHLWLSKAYIDKGNPVKALNTAKPLLEKYPKDHRLLEIVGRAQLDTGRPSDAVTSFKDWAEVQSEASLPHFYLAKAYERLGKTTLARQEIDTALKFNPGHSAARFIKARLLARAGQLVDSKRLLKELSTLNTDSSFVKELEGQIALAENQPQQAINFFKKALEMRQTNFITINLATAQMMVGEQENGFETLREWLVKYPEDITTRNFLANWLLMLDRINEARQEYVKILRMTPDSALAQNNLAWAILQTGNADEALPHAQRARELAPTDPQVMDTLGSVFMVKKEYRNALRLFQDASKIAPDDHEVRFHLAQALAVSGDRKKARVTLEELLFRADKFPSRGKAKMLVKKLQ